METKLTIEKYNQQLIKWVKNHYWDSLDPEKDLLLRHLRTFTGDENLICPDCGGDGEYYVGSSVPDDEGFQDCDLCGKTGKLPTIDEVRQIRIKLTEVQADLLVEEMIRPQYIERIKDLEDFLKIVAAKLDCLPSFANISLGNDHVIRKLDSVLKQPTSGPKPGTANKALEV